MSHAKAIAMNSPGAVPNAPGAATFAFVVVPFCIALASAVYFEQARAGDGATAATKSASGATPAAAPGSAYGFGIGFE